MPDCCDRSVSLILQNILNSGPQESSHFKQTVALSATASKCFCSHSLSTILAQSGVVETKQNFMHPFDKIANDILHCHVDFVDVSTLLVSFGISVVAFRQACCTIPRISSKVFFHPTRSSLVRARTQHNIYDMISMVAAIRSCHSQGIAERDLGESYTRAGHDLLQLIDTGRVVSIHHRIYSASIALSKVQGALEAWQA